MNEQMICPFCDAPYTRDMLKMYDGTFGCDTGCEYYSIVIDCESCKKTVYVKGAFGTIEYDSGALDEVTDAELLRVIEDKKKYV